jgi:hypothetical protein
MRPENTVAAYKTIFRVTTGKALRLHSAVSIEISKAARACTAISPADLTKPALAAELLRGSTTHFCYTNVAPNDFPNPPPVYYRPHWPHWPHRAPRALGDRLGNPHGFYEPSDGRRYGARRLATLFHVLPGDVARLADGADPHPMRSRIEPMLQAVAVQARRQSYGERVRPVTWSDLLSQFLAAWTSRSRRMASTSRRRRRTEPPRQ